MNWSERARKVTWKSRKILYSAQDPSWDCQTFARTSSATLKLEQQVYVLLLLQFPAMLICL